VQEVGAVLPRHRRLGMLEWILGGGTRYGGGGTV